MQIWGLTVSASPLEVLWCKYGRHEVGKESLAIMHPDCKLGAQPALTNSLPAANHFQGLNHSSSHISLGQAEDEAREQLLSGVLSSAGRICDLSCSFLCLAGFSIAVKQPICSKPCSCAAALCLAPRTDRVMMGK